MQIDVDPQEDQQNAPDINYVVENPTLVCAGWGIVVTFLPPRIWKSSLLLLSVQNLNLRSFLESESPYLISKEVL